MVSFSYHNSYYIQPPGCMTDIVGHPSGRNDAMELSVFHDQRSAFFFWNKWTRSLQGVHPPALVSLSGHQELSFPDKEDAIALQALNLESDFEVAFFTWTQLREACKSHVLAAAYLNLIGNVYVHCRPGKPMGAWKEEQLTDRYGNAHHIQKFKTLEELQTALLTSAETAVYLDIDLSFFTIDGRGNHPFSPFTDMSPYNVQQILSPETLLMRWLFERLQGMTIGSEPEAMGGLVKSNYYLSLLNHMYFEPGLFEKDSNWRHLQRTGSCCQPV